MPSPLWSYFPRNERPPAWVEQLVAAVSARQSSIDTEPLPAAGADALTSDVVLGHLRSAMEGLGYTVEAGKKSDQKTARVVR